MSPLAANDDLRPSEKSARQIRHESRERDRLFSRPEDQGLAIGIACGLAIVFLAWVFWRWAV